MCCHCEDDEGIPSSLLNKKLFCHSMGPRRFMLAAWSIMHRLFWKGILIASHSSAKWSCPKRGSIHRIFSIFVLKLHSMHASAHYNMLKDALFKFCCQSLSVRLFTQCLPVMNLMKGAVLQHTATLFSVIFISFSSVPFRAAFSISQIIPNVEHPDQVRQPLHVMACDTLLNHWKPKYGPCHGAPSSQAYSIPQLINLLIKFYCM